MKPVTIALTLSAAICATLLLFHVAENLAVLWWAVILANATWVIVGVVRKGQDSDQ